MSAQVRGAAWQIGAWIADPSDDTLACGVVTLKIEPRMMRLLLCLAQSAGSVVPLERLLAEVWAGVVVGPSSVYQSVSQLRKVLGDTGSTPTYIETVARKGYRLIATVKPPDEVRLAAARAPLAVERRSRERRRRSQAVMYTIAVLASVAIATGLWAGSRLTSQSAKPSIVVLPLADPTSDQTERPSCDGLTEAQPPSRPGSEPTI